MRVTAKVNYKFHNIFRGKSPVGAFAAFGKKGGLSFGGWINAIIPILIVPYYSVIEMCIRDSPWA